MINTKDVAGFLRPLHPQAAGLIGVSTPREPNAVPAAQIADIAKEIGFHAHAAPDISAALTDIRRAAPNARIVICGSLYLAGHVLRQYS